MLFCFYIVSFLGESFSRLKEDKRTYDPIDYECIDKTDFWVVEEEPEGELNYDDLENMVDEQEHEPGSQTQGYIFCFYSLLLVYHMTLKLII